MGTTGSSTSASENDEAVLLREWNFEKFFPDRSSMSNIEGRKMSEPNNLAYQEKRKIEDMNNQLKLENRVKNGIFTRNNFDQKLMSENSPKKADEPSRLSNFVRSFRRENTIDFFPSKRHSAVFDQQSSPAKNVTPQKMQRSSAIFQRNRTKGEPILTDFVAKREHSLGKKLNSERPQEAVRLRQSNNLDFLPMRREKTESVIFVSPRNANSQQFSPAASQQVKADVGKLLQAKNSFLDPKNFFYC